MARTREEIIASEPKLNLAKIRAATEADIRRHAAEDDSEPAGPLSSFVKRRPGQRGPGAKPAKVQIALRVDPETLAVFRASGPGWQTRATGILQEAARKMSAGRMHGRKGRAG